MIKTIVIDGGLGRVITALPALERFIDANPNAQIIVYHWTPIIWGNKKLARNVFDNSLKGLLEKVKDTSIQKPEPYYNSNYLNSRINLADAWNQEINLDDQSMPVPKIYLSNKELNTPKFRNNRPVIAFQPFGSTANLENNQVVDPSNRSLTADFTKKLLQRFKQENFDVLMLTDRPIPFINREDIINYWPENCRLMAAAIANTDYFVGIDSSGQHLARCFDKPGSIIMGGTCPINTTYPDHFNVLNTKNISYNPYRLCEFDSYLAEIENSSNMTFDDASAKELIENIIFDVKGKLGNVHA